ncbi:hypothetical protein SSPS47_21460 [Streptomyces sp. S4.7]|uniref:cell division protein PerM n=1 Tax=Streptomyces sp. S4.7 TaxID=2705439 RepID=UPI0013992F9E|nr:DUF6350 family protein [Streptomyces sp. S4.7]QHY97677.1 hypothetical protein SSPS47_21460 [Streptomyces sp. S4.7]
MTQVSESGTTLSSASASATERGRAAALTAAFLRGAFAAVLGLGSLAALVIAAWISSPYPDSGAGGALRIAAALWLLAHGAELVRPDTLSGVPAPVGVVPLLVMALPVWLVYRSARDALEPDEGRPQLTALGGLCTVAGGYLLVGGAVVLYARGGVLSTHTFGTALELPLVPLLSAAAGVWVASGRPLSPLLDRLSRPGRADTAPAPAAVAAGRRRRAVVAMRSATAGTAALLGGGVFLVLCSLLWHADAAQETFLQLAAAWSGRVAVLLLSVALLPNAAVWGASYALGPGFALGTSATVTPLAVTGSPALPPFPLLAAVPAEGPGMVVTWATGVVPVVAGLVIAWYTVRVAAPPYVERDEAWGAGDTALAAALAGAGCAVLTAALAAVAGGPMGTGRLAEFGPVWWLTGAAALVWTVTIAVPAALTVRAWRLRKRRGTDVVDAPDGPEPAAEVREAGAAIRSAVSMDAPPDAPVDGTATKTARWRGAPWRRGAGTADGAADEGAMEREEGDGAAGVGADGAAPTQEPYDFLQREAFLDRDSGETGRAAAEQPPGGPPTGISPDRDAEPPPGPSSESQPGSTRESEPGSAPEPEAKKAD